MKEKALSLGGRSTELWFERGYLTEDICLF